jgi:uncharacterized membrane protein YhhN
METRFSHCGVALSGFLLPSGLTLAAALTGALHIRAELRGKRRQVYLFKPATTLLILLCALAVRPQVTPRYQVFVALGLLASLAGDIFLMLPQDRFLPGMASFFAAHLFYIAAFFSRTTPILTWTDTLALAVFGIAYGARLWPRLDSLRLPVLVYIIAILLMAAAALGQWRATGAPGAGLAALGALSFVLSDGVLAWDRFRQRVALAPVLVLGPYYLAQALLAWSILV